jgi:hypothetical protein
MLNFSITGFKKFCIELVLVLVLDILMMYEVCYAPFRPLLYVGLVAVCTKQCRRTYTPCKKPTETW